MAQVVEECRLVWASVDRAEGYYGKVETGELDGATEECGTFGCGPCFLFAAAHE